MEVKVISSTPVSKQTAAKQIQSFINQTNKDEDENDHKFPLMAETTANLLHILHAHLTGREHELTEQDLSIIMPRGNAGEFMYTEVVTTTVTTTEYIME